MDEDKRARALKASEQQLFQVWWARAATNTSVQGAFLAGLNMALDAQVHFLCGMPFIATNIVKDREVLFVTDEKVSKLIFTSE